MFQSVMFAAMHFFEKTYVEQTCNKHLLIFFGNHSLSHGFAFNWIPLPGPGRPRANREVERVKGGKCLMTLAEKRAMLEACAFVDVVPRGGGGPNGAARAKFCQLAKICADTA